MLRKLFVLSCLLIITSNVYAEKNLCGQHHCLAVVDAGSTGSRLHIFTYDLDATKTPINVSEVWSKKSKPGFATIEANQNTVDAYMSVLFADSPAQQMPVYFYATAGMRLVPQAKQKIYYQSLKNWFSQQGNWQLMEAKTITGDDEALYDWLAVNYHQGTLKSAAKQSIGVLDIGGASTQIAFPIQNNPNLNQGKQVELTLYGEKVNLFVHSFLGLGQNEMTHQLLDANSCFANNYPLPDGDTGQGNATECAGEIASLINGVHKANNIIQPVLSNNPVNSWYAIGGIANLAESKPFQFPENEFTSQDFLQQANNYTCTQPWEDLSNQFPNNEYLDGYCLLPAFYYALMVEGYGFTPDQRVHYVPSSQNLDWTLGVVLHH